MSKLMCKYFFLAANYTKTLTPVCSKILLSCSMWASAILDSRGWTSAQIWEKNIVCFQDKYILTWEDIQKEIVFSSRKLTPVRSGTEKDSEKATHLHWKRMLTICCSKDLRSKKTKEDCPQHTALEKCSQTPCTGHGESSASQLCLAWG